MPHDQCVHGAVCPGVVYCFNSEILFIRADQVQPKDSGTDSTDPFEVFACTARRSVKALRGVPVSGAMMVAKHIELPEATPGFVHALDVFFRFPPYDTREAAK